MSNPFFGDVLFLDRPTSDRRRIKAATSIGVDDSVAVFTYDGVEPPVRAGTVDVSDWPDDGTLTLAGTVDLRPGDYPCGVQLRSMEIEPPPADLSDDDLVAWLFGDNSEEVCVGGIVCALTVYVGPDAESKPAWPGTHITVLPSAAPGPNTSDRIWCSGCGREGDAAARATWGYNGPTILRPAVADDYFCSDRCYDEWRIGRGARIPSGLPDYDAPV